MYLVFYNNMSSIIYLAFEFKGNKQATNIKIYLM